MNLEDLKQIMPEIFETVKNDVRKIVNEDVIEVLGQHRHRAGLSLGLAELGMRWGAFIAGMHFHPGTEIIMNTSPLKKILENQEDDIIWAYTYHILLHEYIHSLRIINEERCRRITLNISEEIFKDTNHPALILARNGIGAFIKDLNVTFVPPEQKPDGIPIEYVSGFDKESQTYFS